MLPLMLADDDMISFLPVNCTSMITNFDNGMPLTPLTLSRQLVHNIIKSKQNKENPNKNAMNNDYAMTIKVYTVISANGLIHE